MTRGRQANHFVVYWITAMESCIGDCSGVQAQGIGMFLFLVPGAAFNLVFGIIWFATERKDPSARG